VVTEGKASTLGPWSESKTPAAALVLQAEPKSMLLTAVQTLREAAYKQLRKES
jgi:hypothetical protein